MRKCLLVIGSDGVDIGMVWSARAAALLMVAYPGCAVFTQRGELVFAYEASPMPADVAVAWITQRIQAEGVQ